MTEEYQILCCNCKKDLTSLIAERFAPTLKKISKFFLNTPGRMRVGVKDAKALTSCPSCGFQHEYEVDINGLAERSLERMK